jgi:hypothetical protein
MPSTARRCHPRSTLCQPQQLEVAAHRAEPGELIRFVCLPRDQSLLDHDNDSRYERHKVRNVRLQDLRNQERLSGSTSFRSRKPNLSQDFIETGTLGRLRRRGIDEAPTDHGRETGAQLLKSKQTRHQIEIPR